MVLQDLISRLLERKPTRRLGMLNGRAADIKRHKWFDGLDWDALEARRMEPPRLPKDDSAKRLRELTVSPPHHSLPAQPAGNVLGDSKCAHCTCCSQAWQQAALAYAWWLAMSRASCQASAGTHPHTAMDR